MRPVDDVMEPFIPLLIVVAWCALMVWPAKFLINETLKYASCESPYDTFTGMKRYAESREREIAEKRERSA